MASKAISTAATLGKLRLRRERAALESFLRWQYEAASAQLRLASLQSAMAHHTGEARARLHEAGGGDMGAYRRAVAELQAAIAAEQATIADAKKHLAGKRDELLSARAQRKAAEVLQNRAWQREQAAAERLEIKQMDEDHAARELSGTAASFAAV